MVDLPLDTASCDFIFEGVCVYCWMLFTCLEMTSLLIFNKTYNEVYFILNPCKMVSYIFKYEVWCLVSCLLLLVSHLLKTKINLKLK